MNFRRRPTTPATDDIDLTSLIDVIFILLIFFLVTASFSQTEDRSVSVDLPQGSDAGQIETQEEITVFIEQNGTVTLERGDKEIQKDIRPEALEAHLRHLHDELGARPIFLRGDENVRYKEVVHALNACKNAGFTKVYNVVRGPKTP